MRYHDPIMMENVFVMSATALDANEVLVIYRYDTESQKVSRRIQHGPCIYFPAANEWLAVVCFINRGNGIVLLCKYVFECVCACVCAYVCICACVCICVCMCV